MQVLSHCKGGVIVRYNEQGTVFVNGANAGGQRFKSFYTACFADVEQEIRPIVEECRLTLVYKLSWIGKGAGPTANVRMYADRISEVAAARSRSPGACR